MKKIITISILLTALLLTLGCSRGSSMSGGLTSSQSVASAYETAYFDSEEIAYNVERRREAQVADGDSNPADSISADLSNTERKLVKRATIRIRVENLDATDASVTELMRKYDAYSASTNLEENYYSYILRVPSPLYDVFLAEMNGLGRQLRRSENTEDVTLRYYDLEGRLATKRELLKTYQSYLTRANDIEEVLSVEARIADLQSDIEGTGMQLRNLANRVDYATIELHVFGPVNSAPNRGETFGEQIKELFGNLGSFLSAIAIIIIGIVVYGIPIILFAALLIWLFFGRIGLLKKLWQTVMGKKEGH
jgi:hypothetical protein